MENLIKLKVKRLCDSAKLPTQAHDTDSGFDIYANNVIYDIDNNLIVCYSGIAIEPPSGYHIELFPRSSNSKLDLILGNSIGLIDWSYRGELIAKYRIIHPPSYGKGDTRLKFYSIGDKFAQIVLRKTYPMAIMEVSELGKTERGEKGFGSTGK